MAEITNTTEKKTGSTIRTASPASTASVTKTPAVTPTPTVTDRNKKIMNATSIGSSLGLIGGLVYSFHNKKSFWGYVGYGLLFSIIGGTVAGVGAQIVVKKEPVD